MAIKDLNCMIHYGDGNWVPAQRVRDVFLDPMGHEIAPPAQCRDMSVESILKVMDGVRRDREVAAARAKANLQ